MADDMGITLNALPVSVRSTAHSLVESSRVDGWRTAEVEATVCAMANEILRLREQVAAVRVDRDRGIREALKRAEDCAEHGAAIRHEGHQAYWFATRADMLDEQRRAYLTVGGHIREWCGRGDAGLAARVLKLLDAADRDVARIRSRYPAPTFADCAKAGRCEHPSPPPHGVCEQMRLDLEAA